MAKRQVFRYTVKVDDRPHTFDLTNDPLHVANGATHLYRLPLVGERG